MVFSFGSEVDGAVALGGADADPDFFVGQRGLSPVRMLRTVPSLLRVGHEKQMPIRQPDCGVRPAASAWSRMGSPVFGTVRPVRANVTSRRLRRPPTSGA